MRRGDREIALAFAHMEASDKDFALSHLPNAKATRVKDELTYQKRLRITHEQYERVVDTMIKALSGGRIAATKSYIRPRRNR